MSSQTMTTALRQLPEVGNPFELFTYIHSDLDKLKSQARNAQKGKITSKLLKGLTSSPGNLPSGEELELSGMRLSKNLNDEHAIELSKKLVAHPDDSDARLELVEMFVVRNESLDLDIARDAYLLSLFEVENMLLNTHKINAVVVTQTIYLKKLYGFLNTDYASAQEKMDSDNQDTHLHDQVKQMQGGVSFVRGCFSLLKTGTIPHKYELNLHDARGSKSINFDEIKNGYDPMLRRLNLIPSASQNRELMLDILKRLEKKNPLVGYHESKMYEVQAQINLASNMIKKDKETQKKGFDFLAKAMNAISLAVDLVGSVPDKAEEIATVMRYGQLCYTIQHSFESNGITPTNEHKQRIKKAVSMMELIADDQKVKNLQNKLLRVLSDV